jgi:ectoine hydroxylase-related dioxygenase (phytanoyl-CoA dioxygenase family)
MMNGEHIDHYREHGYAVIRSLFDHDEVAEIATAFDRVYAEGILHGRSLRVQNVLFHIADDEALGAIVRMVQWPSYFSKVLEKYRRDTRILDALAPLLGSDLKQIINQMHWKPPGASMVEFGFHQDSRSRRPPSEYTDLENSYIQSGIAIDPHRRKNGAMIVYPGSHRLGEIPFDPKRRSMHAHMDDGDLIRMGLDPAQAVCLELEPGDFAFWNVYTLHGSGPNTSSIDRRFYINGYVTAANCGRGEWAFRDGKPCELSGDPALVHYEELHTQPGPMYVD